MTLCVRQRRNLLWMPNEMGICEIETGETNKDQIVAMQKLSMRTRSLICLILLVTLSGCQTFRDFPIVNPLPSPYEPAAPPRCHQTIKFPGGPATQPLIFPINWSVLLQKALKDYGGCSSSSPVVDNSKGAETEVVVSVLNKLSHSTWYKMTMVLVFIGSGGLFPTYSWQDGWALSYSVYDQNALNKTYTYEITLKEFYSIVLLPFLWINFFTYSLEDALRSTTAQFVVDAQRDGYL